jgi:PLP dependent protein
MNALENCLESVRERIVRASHRAGRDPQEITLLAVTKTVEPEKVLLGINLGISHMGENRVQEAERKFKAIDSLRASATWHLIGHLQTNKARRTLELFDVIQSVDSIRLAQQLDRVAGELNRSAPVYLEVNLGSEPAKSGVLPDKLMTLAEALADCENLRVDGLMAVPPYSDDPEAVRPYFKMLRQLREDLNRRRLLGNEVTGLSMGMSNDFEVAIEEGATIVRIGTAIWGARTAIVQGGSTES